MGIINPKFRIVIASGEGRKKRGDGHIGFICIYDIIFLYRCICKIYIDYVNTLIKPLIFYRSLPVDQTFLALMKMIRCAPLDMVRLLANSKSGRLGYLGVFKISGLPILILCKSLSPHVQVQIIHVKLLCTLSVKSLLSVTLLSIPG